MLRTLNVLKIKVARGLHFSNLHHFPRKPSVPILLSQRCAGKSLSIELKTRSWKNFVTDVTGRPFDISRTLIGLFA